MLSPIFHTPSVVAGDRHQVKVTHAGASYTATYSGELTNDLKNRIIELAGFLSKDDDIKSLTDRNGTLTTEGNDYRTHLKDRIDGLEEINSRTPVQEEKLTKLRNIYNTLVRTNEVAQGILNPRSSRAEEALSDGGVGGEVIRVQRLLSTPAQTIFVNASTDDGSAAAASVAQSVSRTDSLRSFHSMEIESLRGTGVVAGAAWFDFPGWEQEKAAFLAELGLNVTEEAIRAKVAEDFSPAYIAFQQKENDLLRVEKNQAEIARELENQLEGQPPVNWGNYSQDIAELRAEVADLREKPEIKREMFREFLKGRIS